MANAVPEDSLAPPEQNSARDSSWIHRWQCAQCHGWFWASDTGRERCFVCDRLPAPEGRAALDHIQRGAV